MNLLPHPFTSPKRQAASQAGFPRAVRHLLLPAILLPVVMFAAAFRPADLEAHRKWMDDAQERKDDIREALAAKDAAKLRLGAKSLETLTAREQAFWLRSTLKQAQELAAKNRAEARDLLQAAQTSRFDDAEKVFATLERTCSACHDLHFEKHPSMAPAPAK